MAPTRYRRTLKPSDKAFDFTNRKMAGTPLRDDEATRAEKERLINEWLEKNGKEG